jgi:hypothetical protein
MEHTLRHDITKASSECKTQLKFDNSLAEVPQNLFILFNFPCLSNEIVAYRPEARQTELNCYISWRQVFCDILLSFILHDVSILHFKFLHDVCILHFKFSEKRNNIQKNRNLNPAVLELLRLHCMFNNVIVNFDHNWSHPVFS